MAICKNCHTQLHRDEVAIYKRLVNRGAKEEELLCKGCLAQRFGVTVELIDEKIKHFKEMGCTLF